MSGWSKCRHGVSVTGLTRRTLSGTMPYRPPVLRVCSKSSCQSEAVATLTYAYADSEAVVGPLSQHKEPHAYDLCAGHAERLSAPVGWRIVRHRPYPEAM
jgi:hypothetical protein